uniref:Uncharacterized protein n=1 Tax=Salmo trutta TaxID=8032 RepID=A0A674AE99_SALTR
MRVSERELLLMCFSLSVRGGWWHRNWGGRARGNDWNGMSGFHVFDATPFAPFQTLLRAVLPSAASTGVISPGISACSLCNCVDQDSNTSNVYSVSPGISACSLCNCVDQDSNTSNVYRVSPGISACSLCNCVDQDSNTSNVYSISPGISACSLYNCVDQDSNTSNVYRVSPGISACSLCNCVDQDSNTSATACG